MKRLGTRLGMLVGVVGLAVMAITQAQKDYSSTSSLEFVDLKNQLAPPRPIGGEGFEGSSWPAPPDTHIVRGSDSGVAPIATSPAAAPAIQLASHQEPIEDGANNAPPSFSMPVIQDSSETPEFSAPASPSFDLPATLPTESDDSQIGTGVANAAPAAMPAFSAPNASEAPTALSPSPAAAQPQTIQMPDSAFEGVGQDSPAATPVAAAAAPATEPAPTADAQSVMTQRGIGIQGGSPLVDMPEGYQAEASGASPAATPTLTSPGFDMPSDSAPPTAAPAPMRSAAPAPIQPQAAAAPAIPREAIATPPPAPRIAPAPQASIATAAPIARTAQPSGRPADARNVLAQPGSRLLEGAQAPSVTIHKRAPEEINVGKQATLAIQIRNTGVSDALNVVVTDAIPEGMELIEATPAPEIQGKLMTWQFGDLEPAGERTITLQMMPLTEGELGSVARLSFEAAASVRTLSTRPELKIVQRASEQVLVGQQVEIEIEVSNPGTGTAYGVVLQEDVPEGLEHPKGKQLDNLLGDIQPGQVRRQRLILKAAKPGVANNYIQLISEDQVVAKNALPIEVISPQLAIQMEGPTRRFLERQAKYMLQIANNGTASATNVDVVAYLDRGLSFVSTEFKGQYDATRHAVFWSLAELPVGEAGEVPLVLLPIEPGEQLVRLEAQADLGIQARNEKPITVETLAEITFSVNDDHDPIETNSLTTYEIRITNSGSREDTNVQLQVAVPPGLEFVRSDQQAQVDGRGIVSFAPLPRMTAQDEHTFRVTVKGVATGTHVLQAVLTSDQSRVPVTKEESTMVYADE
ncbi:Large cysteine-rich periplasmic protein OmcB [Rosistilla ulvae]|uniref:Large cysteine-rich periplasmic protein OmcB n=1 Tax=Rosistilla ulvae TaxID=1930277 RepID=A0A517M7I1_9BACT|nr:DUF11 domain-containing protein [Rosistilla ulvae]QDS90825.1 Large cysteine-rich periplasmic protein OmcB [Rosistilla ulvae]